MKRGAKAEIKAPGASSPSETTILKKFDRRSGDDQLGATLESEEEEEEVGRMR
jgi:hypothetical protein